MLYLNSFASSIKDHNILSTLHAQEIGGENMYARYYVNFLDLRICVVFCLEPGHDDDGNSTMGYFFYEESLCMVIRLCTVNVYAMMVTRFNIISYPRKRLTIYF